MSWPAASAGRPGVGASSRLAEFAQSLKQHVDGGLSPELALDLALNELVVAATTLTHASATAVALSRGDAMVYRAATGDHAPGLGIQIHTRVGLSGACIRSRSTQYCRDTESDQRVDPDVSHLLGIRSILVVPVLQLDEPVGIIEVFSRQSSAFSDADELHLREFAVDCLKLRQLSLGLTQPPYHKLDEPVSVENSAPRQGARTGNGDRRFPPGPPSPKIEQDLSPPWETLETNPLPPSAPKSRPDFWTLVLAVLVAVAAIALIFLIAFPMASPSSHRSHPVQVGAPPTPAPEQNVSPAKLEPPETKSGKGLVITSQSKRPDPPASGGLVIYDRGKVIYRSQPTSESDLRAPPSVTTSAHKVARAWLSPALADARLRDRVEPEYPPEARAANRSGEVTLKILVRKDGSVASVHIVKGDRLLAHAAAAAVRNWRYEPYKIRGQPEEFLTQVTLTFSLSQ